MAIKTHRSGYIFKKGGLFKSTKKRWLILTDEELAYFDDVSSTSAPPIDRIYLRLIVCAENTGNVENIKGKNYYEFLVKTNLGRDYQIYAESENERNVWIESINKLTHAFKSPVKSFVKATDPNMFN
ncbi:predicted protein [Naegleria gruberi]|uniref:Predicted protein n=1 Tax=Naegleria gruberi TaxID=5762 RepID=D2V6I9_NAEGR|nr:uncharacterized protein NAEGRDRAFT_64454 [Naegleria gruberi]EFC47582.1 predicted protein [Naegleria gruberi]|eukprot:XP_002680326.1 predicted protein [Naegleria gruberi strain NEG-M]